MRIEVDKDQFLRQLECHPDLDIDGVNEWTRFADKKDKQVIAWIYEDWDGNKTYYLGDV